VSAFIDEPLVSLSAAPTLKTIVKTRVLAEKSNPISPRNYLGNFTYMHIYAVELTLQNPEMLMQTLSSCFCILRLPYFSTVFTQVEPQNINFFLERNR
jgi:hypothetical protein